MSTAGRLNPGPDREVKRVPAALGSPGVHEKRIEIRWRDLDAYDHVNNAVYLTYLEECRDEWLDGALGDGPGAWDLVIARIAIDYRRELRREDDAVLVRCRLDRIGSSSVTTREQILTLAGEISAEAETVLVARDPQTLRPRPLRPEERRALEGAGPA
jgi:acyl-CoA thioester hydrolase